ncbi:MAG: hypothetical protein ABWK00_06225, partial [Desulfurococcaceae archaeon]
MRLLLLALLRHRWSLWSLTLVAFLGFLAGVLLSTAGYMGELSSVLVKFGGSSVTAWVSQCSVGGTSLAVLTTTEPRVFVERGLLVLKEGRAGNLLVDERAASTLGVSSGDYLEACGVSGRVSGVVEYAGGVVVV